MSSIRPLWIALTLVLPATPVLAACNQELAVYSDPDKTVSLEFRPHDGEAVTVTNRFRLIAGGKMIDGFVQWSGEPAARAYGMLTEKCPQGDVTGEEIAACTVWHGPVYAVADDGSVSLLPGQGEQAAPRLLLSDLAWSFSQHPVFTETGLAKPPFELFQLSGCQE